MTTHIKTDLQLRSL